MRKQLKKILLLALTVAMFCPSTAIAKTRSTKVQLQNTQEKSVLLPESVKHSVGREIEVERSKALANALCTITNTERGIIGVYAETAMFIPVDWACLTIYLEQWNEEKNTWNTVETFEKEFTPEDAVDGNLTSVALSISVGTQPVGYYYRIRCIHELEYDNGWYEAKSTKTEGVLLTNIK